MQRERHRERVGERKGAFTFHKLKFPVLEVKKIIHVDWTLGS